MQLLFSLSEYKAHQRYKELPTNSFRLRSGIGNLEPMVKSSQLPVFVNKVLLSHSHSHSFMSMEDPEFNGGWSWVVETDDMTTELKRFTICLCSENVC